MARLFKWIVGVSLVVLVVALAGLAGLFRTDTGRSALRDAIVRAAEARGWRLSIDHLSGALPFEVQASGIAVADEKGAFLRVAAADIQVDPSALLGGRLVFETLALERVFVERPPEVPASDGATEPNLSDATPVLPGIPISVRALSITPLALGPEITGETVVLDIAANTSVDAEVGIDAGFKIARLDGDGVIEGRLGANAALTHLKTSIKGRSDQGGWISRLLGLPGAPAIQVTLDGEGPIEAFEARYEISAGEDLATWGTIRPLSIQPLAIAVAGGARVAGFIPSEARSELSGDADYRLSIAFDPEFSRVTVADLIVDTPEIAVTGQLDADLRSGTLEANASVDLLRPSLARSLVLDLGLAEAKVAVNASGPLLNPKINAEISVADLALAGNQAEAIKAKIAATIGPPVDGSVSVEANGLRIPDAPVNSIGDALSGRVRFILADNVLKLSGMELQTGPAGIVGDATVNLTSSAASLSIEATYGRLEYLAPPLASGRLESTFHAEYDGSHAVLQVGGRLLDLQPVDNSLAPALSGVAEFWLAARQISTSGWEISGLEVANDVIAASARGTGDLVTRAGEATVSIRLDDLAALDISETLTSGSAGLVATAKGSVDAADIDWTVTTKDMMASGVAFPRVAAGGTLRVTSTTLSGPVQIDAETPVGPARATADIAFDGGLLGLSEIDIARAEDRIRGGLTIAPAPLAVTGELDLVIGGLADWATLAGLDLDAGVSARVEASHAGGKQSVVASAMLDNLAIAGATPSRVKSIEVGARLEDVLGAPEIDANVVASNAEIAGALIKDLTISTIGGLSDLRFDMKGTGTVNGQALRLETAGTSAFVDGVGLRVDALKVEGAGVDTVLLRPTRATLAGGAATLSPTSLSLFGGTLELGVETDGSTARARMEARNINLPPIAALAGTRLSSGVLNASGTMSGLVAAPDGRFSLAMTDIKGFGPPNTELPPVSLEITAGLTKGALESRATVSGIGETPFEARVATRIPGHEPVVPLEARLSWRGGLDEIVAALPLDGTLITGDASIDLNFSGELDTRDGSIEPSRTEGRISARGARVENFVSGAILDPLDVAVRLEGTRLVVEKMAAGDTTGGTLRVAGAVDLVEPSKPKVDLGLVMEAMTVARRDDAEIQLDAKLDLRSGDDRLAITGEVVNHLTEIRLIGALPAEVVELTVEEVRDGVVVARETEPDTGADAAPVVDLDIKFSAPGKIFVRGRGLDSEWGGDIRISGDIAKPRLAGSIGPVRGGFEFAGRRFELGDGGVAFSGGEEIEPELNISAIHEAADFKALVSVTGTPSKPEIELSSDPSYPEDEILAKILFGKFTARLTATEALQLAQSTRTLLSGEPGTLDKIRGAIGVDVLTFAPGASESELGRLKAGKYVRDDLFVGVEQGTTAGSTRSIVEWHLTPKVTVEGTVGSSSESTLGIQRRWEY